MRFNQGLQLSFICYPSIQTVLSIMLLRFARQTGRTLANFSTSRPLPYTGKNYHQLMTERQHLFPLYTHYYKELFLPVQGHQEFLYDQNGKKYIDLVGGISCLNIGHSHPRITRIYQQEAGKLLNLSSHYVHPYQGQYAEKLCKELGNDLDTTFFFSSGSQANDFAALLAKAYTKSHLVLSLRNGYHGTAGNSYGLTNIKSWNSPLYRNLQLQRLAYPNIYRSHQSYDSMIKDAEEQIETGTNGKVAGLWIEPVMGAGGIVPLPKDYIQRLYSMVKRHGGLYISDQVQTGFYRIGKQKWGFKWHEVKPDIVVMAKAIANAQPLSAVVTRREIADALHHDYFPAFAAGPLEFRIASEVLSVLQEENYHLQAQQIGGYLLRQFKRIKEQTNCKHIGDVRGKGMMVGMQIIKDQESKEPDLEILSVIFEKAREAGVLFGKGGHLGHLIRVLGPLCLSRKSAETAIGVFEEVIRSLPK